MKADNVAMGRRLRDLRLGRGLQQAEAARRLALAAPLLSLVENGKRTLQLPLLLDALELYGVGMEDFMASLGEKRVDEGLARLLDESLLRSLNLSQDDIASLSAEPKMVTTITALFNLYKNTRSQLDNVLEGIAQRERSEDDDAGDELRFDYSPFDEVTDFLEANDNYFGALEERAEAFRRDANLEGTVRSDQLEAALESQLGVTVAELADAGDSSVIWRWDEAKRALLLSPAMFEQRRKFHLAHTIALRTLDAEGLHKPILDGYPYRHAETRRLIKIHLANYLAGALLLPYGAFFEDVQRTRYDVERLARRYETSYESVAHRMCNLGDPKRRGLPMHFLRVDVAGNISKRYAGDDIRFSHQEGSCPKMAVHLAFLTPNVLTRQYSTFPDGTTYFCFAKVVTSPEQGSIEKGTVYSIGLGTHADNAKHLAYADDMPLVDPQRQAVPVGTTCRFCERADCNMRAAPSYKYAFRVDEYTKKDNFFSPIVSADEVRRPRRKKPG